MYVLQMSISIIRPSTLHLVLAPWLSFLAPNRRLSECGRLSNHQLNQNSPELLGAITLFYWGSHKFPKKLLIFDGRMGCHPWLPLKTLLQNCGYMKGPNTGHGNRPPSRTYYHFLHIGSICKPRGNCNRIYFYIML